MDGFETIDKHRLINEIDGIKIVNMHMYIYIFIVSIMT